MTGNCREMPRTLAGYPFRLLPKVSASRLPIGGAAGGDVFAQGLPVPADLEGVGAAVLEIGFPGVAGALEAIDQEELGLRVQGVSICLLVIKNA